MPLVFGIWRGRHRVPLKRRFDLLQLLAQLGHCRTSFRQLLQLSHRRSRSQKADSFCLWWAQAARSKLSSKVTRTFYFFVIRAKREVTPVVVLTLADANAALCQQFAAKSTVTFLLNQLSVSHAANWTKFKRTSSNSSLIGSCKTHEKPKLRWCQAQNSLIPWCVYKFPG